MVAGQLHNLWFLIMNVTEMYYEYPSRKGCNFIVDADKDFSWLRSYDFSEFERLIVCYDSNVCDLYLSKVFEALNSHAQEIIKISLLASEETKSLNYYCKFIQNLEYHGCTKFDLTIAVGGGTILDLVSFSASTYMRGIPLMMIPTTLMGQVDASTAGKTCINTSNTKNMLGTFYYPRLVYNNVNFLLEQNPYYFRQGLSEVLKYGLLDSTELVNHLSKGSSKNDLEWLCKLVILTIQSRVKICKIDPAASNLGHTFGHAIEKLSNYTVLHGDAINIGTVMALYFSLKIGIINEEIVLSIIEIMRNLQLNLFVDPKYNVSQFIELMRRDKKCSNKYLNLVLIADIGKPYEANGSRFFKASYEVMTEFLNDFLSSSEFIFEK